MNIFKTVALVAFIGASSACARVFRVLSTEPAFCNGLECPKFTVEKTTKEYELRMYPTSSWVSTNIVGMDYDKATSEGFHRLFDYISGANELNMKIDMTAPVTTRVIPGPGPACESNFTVSFFVPFKYQENPPKPTSPDVFISSLPEFEAYVRSFKGFAGQDEYLKEAATLAADLSNATISHHTDFFYTAGYDSPFKPFNRHNEVWYFKM